MVLNARNFITFILIVFYSVLNSDNAYGSLTEQDCQDGLREYCGEALSDILECAKQAVMMYRRKASDAEVMLLRQERERLLERGLKPSAFYTVKASNEIERALLIALEDQAEDGEGYNRQDRPDFVIEYFDINVIPYVSKGGSYPLHQFCRGDVFRHDPEFETVFYKMIQYGYDALLAMISVCDAQIPYLDGRPIEYYIFKNEEFTHYRIERIYLKHIASYLKLINVPETGLQTPEEYCKRYR